MKFDQRLSVITVGADDMNLMRVFYTEILGWKPVTGNKDIVFFNIGQCLFSICDKKMLAGVIGVHHCGLGFRGVTFGYNVRERSEVDDAYNYLLNKGVNILQKPTIADFGGYFMYFTDVEGNILEVAHNPYIPLDETGAAITHHDITRL